MVVVASAAQSAAENLCVGSATSIPLCGTRARNWLDGLAVPMSKPRYTWRESALTMTSGRCLASIIASAVFPDAVGPHTTPIVGAGRLASTEAAFELIPRQMYDRGSSM